MANKLKRKVGGAKGALTKSEKERLVRNMTEQVMEDMTGKESWLRYREAEIAKEMEGKSMDEKNAILDDFAEEIESDFSFVGSWKPSLKKATYVDDEGNEVKGQILLDRNTLKKNVRELVKASVDNLLAQVIKMKKAAETGQTARIPSLSLGIENSEEFNGAVAKALVENLPEKLEGNVKVEAETKTTE